MNYNELINAIYELYYNYDNTGNYLIIDDRNYSGHIKFTDLKSGVYADIPDPAYGDYGYGAVYNQIVYMLKLNRSKTFKEVAYI